jgi:DNA-binding NtrC family response regulator
VLIALGGGELRTYPLAAGAELVIGRDLDCNIVLDHHRVSRRHARLRVAGGGGALAIEDLGSRNGTRIGDPLQPHQPCPLRAGDAIGIGPFLLTVVRGALQSTASLAVEDPLASAPSEELREVARGAASVLIRGEAGTSSRTLAEALHRLSERGGPFVSIDCAAIAPELLEGELFGGGPGAAADGALAAAGEGTLLLEEIGALPAPLQLRLLHAVEGREVAPAGGAEPTATAARLICATHRDLFALIEAGGFRLDLYYRLAGATLTLRHLRAGLAPDEEAERRKILDALDRAGGSQAHAAKLLGITRGALASKLAGYRISRPPRPRR